MTGKVKLTREQVAFIEAYEKNIASYNGWEDHLLSEHAQSWGKGYEGVKPAAKCMKTLTPMYLARALRDGYEVEEEFKVGDWVVRKDGRGFSNDRKAVEIKCVEPFNNYKNFKVWFLGGGYLHDDEVRHATPEEIKAEQERRVWAKIGRRPREFRLGDAYENNKGIIYTFDKPGRINAIEDMYDRGSLKGIYPAESFISFGGGEE